mgnify:CR=1 FL=1
MKARHSHRRPPVVLTCAGLDPVGGAGLSADIEAIAARGGRCAPVATTIAIQDTVGVRRLAPIPADVVVEQAAAVLDDLPVSAIKLGVLGSAESARELAELFRARAPTIPILTDPVLAAGSGDALATADLQDALFTHILPISTLATPNQGELLQLAEGMRGPDSGAAEVTAERLEHAARTLLATGCGALLATGTDATAGTHVRNRLYTDDGVWAFDCHRLPGVFHGSGCTLASAIAYGLAAAAPGRTSEELAGQLRSIVQAATDYTWRTLATAHQLGRGQLHPNRFPSPDEAAESARPGVVDHG